ncbi:MAG: sensor histidine kinase [Lachnospiraceae bacterium]|nr:sensor histidine kinase [Lachnospiraceae bacterium]
MKKERSRQKSNKRHSLVTGLRAITFLMVLVMACSFFFAVLYLVRQERIKNIKGEAERTLTTLEDGVLAEIGRYKELSRLIMMDKGVVKYLSAERGELDGGFKRSTRYSILNILNVTTMVDSVFVFRNDGHYINSSHDKYLIDEDRRKEEEWLREILERRGASVISINGNGAIRRNNGVPFMSIGRVINDITSQEKIGILFMNISTVCLDRKLEVLGGKNMIVMSEDGIVLSGDESLKRFLPPAGCPETITHTMVQDGVSKVMISYCHVPDTPLIIACATKIGSGFVMFETVRVIMVLILIFLMLIVIASVFIKKNVTNPVKELTRAMERNKEAGRLEPIEASIVDNEIGMLKDTYNAMVERINDLFTRNIENEKVIRRAELRVLQEQIKPHFLYNSLETISYLALDAGADNVHDALETLGSFYRNFLSKGDRTITLAREVRIVRDYLALQKLRYGDVIEDVYDIPEEIGNTIVPKLILQPVVENSIYHGIRLKGEKGLIRISARYEVDRLHLIIYDTGVGMTQEQIDRCLSPEKPVEHEGPESSFGLWGTIERVRIWCGKEDVVKIRSEVGEYTEVEFIISERQEEDGKEDPGNDH